MIFQIGLQMPNINVAQIISTLATGLMIGLSVIAIIVVLYLINYYLSYNIGVTLLEQASNGLNKLNDRGRVDKKKGEWKSLKYGKKFDFFIPDSEYYVQSGRSKTLFGYVKNDSVSWLKVSPNPGFIPASANLKVLTVQRLRRNWEATQNKVGFWDKYGHQIIWGATMVIFLVVIILILNRFDKVIEMVNSVATAAASTRLQTI